MSTQGSPWTFGDVLGALGNFIAGSVPQWRKQAQDQKAQKQQDALNSWEIFNKMPMESRAAAWTRVRDQLRAAGYEVPESYNPGPITIGDMFPDKSKIPDQWKPYATMPYNQLGQVATYLNQQANEEDRQQNRAITMYNALILQLRSNPDLANDPAYEKQLSQAFTKAFGTPPPGYDEKGNRVSPGQPQGGTTTPQTPSPSGVSDTQGIPSRTTGQLDFTGGVEPRTPTQAGSTTAAPGFFAQMSFGDYFKKRYPDFYARIKDNAGVQALLGEPFDQTKLSSMISSIRSEMKEGAGQKINWGEATNMIEGAFLSGQDMQPIVEQLASAGFSEPQIQSLLALGQNNARKGEMVPVTIGGQSVWATPQFVAETARTAANRVAANIQTKRGRVESDNRKIALLQGQLSTAAEEWTKAVELLPDATKKRIFQYDASGKVTGIQNQQVLEVALSTTPSALAVYKRYQLLRQQIDGARNELLLDQTILQQAEGGGGTPSPSGNGNTPPPNTEPPKKPPAAQGIPALIGGNLAQGITQGSRTLQPPQQQEWWANLPLFQRVKQGEVKQMIRTNKLGDIIRELMRRGFSQQQAIDLIRQARG